jgi:ketosteroid isomerase-like protein
MTKTVFPREEIEAALAVHRETQNRQDWDAYVEHFTEDGVYVEHECGTFRGHDEIRAWLVPAMAPLVDAGWVYPIEWTVIEGNKAIYRWLNRLPNPDGREREYEFAGITVLEYAGGGRFSHQEDFYNMKECEQVLREFFAAGGTM